MMPSSTLFTSLLLATVPCTAAWSVLHQFIPRCGPARCWCAFKVLFLISLLIGTLYRPPAPCLPTCRLRQCCAPPPSLSFTAPSLAAVLHTTSAFFIFISCFFANRHPLPSSSTSFAHLSLATVLCITTWSVLNQPVPCCDPLHRCGF